MKFDSYFIGRPVKGLVKQWAIWAGNKSGNSHVPLIYLQRPKWIKDDAKWEEIVSSLVLNLNKSMDVK